MTKEEWTAILNRDAAYDGVFYYALKTSKKVSRPSCTGRTPNPKHVVIYHSLTEALDAGFAPCRRCHPELAAWHGAKAELAENAKKLIEEHYLEEFSLRALSDQLFVNESYLARTFREITGQTLLEYHNLYRCQLSRELLKNPLLKISYISDTVGYHSSSHYTRCFRSCYGCTPSAYRREVLDQSL